MFLLGRLPLAVHWLVNIFHQNMNHLIMMWRPMLHKNWKQQQQQQTTSGAVEETKKKKKKSIINTINHS